MSEEPKRRKRKVPATKPKPKRTGKSLHVFIPPGLRNMLDELMEEESRSLTTLVVFALEMLAKDRGRGRRGERLDEAPGDE